MKNAEQLLLFDMPDSELRAVWKEVEKVKLSGDKTRKRLFSELNELKEQIIELRADNERLKFHSGIKQTFRWSA